jgi:dTDP-4-dehydrorhamnose reductase
MTAPLLVTGGSGQLASALRHLGGGQVRVVGRPEFDFDRKETIEFLFAAGRPRLVVNAAAWTAVDLAEREPDAAWQANCEGPARLAALCAANEVGLVHVSTDYVFDGSKGAPYLEGDAPSPAGVYGASKLAGEAAVMRELPAATILRTAWVYSATGKNFARSILGAAARGAPLRVVADQTGCPTSATDLAAAVLRVARARLEAPNPVQAGIFHAVSEGATTWHGFASALLEEAALLGQAAVPIDAIATADWPTPARRPANSRLDCARLHAVFNLQLPYWRDSVADVVRAIVRPDDNAIDHTHPGRADAVAVPPH